MELSEGKPFPALQAIRSGIVQGSRKEAICSIDQALWRRTRGAAGLDIRLVCVAV
jgi:hypothetical protein